MGEDDIDDECGLRIVPREHSRPYVGTSRASGNCQQWPRENRKAHQTYIAASYFNLVGRLLGRPNISIAGEVGAKGQRLPNEKNCIVNGPIKVCPEEGILIASDFGSAD